MSIKKHIVVAGVDVGSESTKVVLGSTMGCEIVRTEVGGHTAPTLISFNGKSRNMGATANAKAGTNAVHHLNRLLKGEFADNDDAFKAFYQFQLNEGMVQNLNYQPSDSFSASALLAMLFGNIHENVKAAVKRIKDGSSDGEEVEYHYVVSISSGTTPEAQDEWLNAVYAGTSCTNVKLVENSVACQYCYARKFPEQFASPQDGVLVIDMGHAQTTVALLGQTLTPTPEEEQKSEEEQEKETPPVTVVKGVRHKSLGSGLVDIALWDHFVQDKKLDVKKNSKKGQRLLEGCKKLKHLLSQLPEATVTVENVVEDQDLKLSATRTLAAELSKSTCDAMKELIQQVLSESTHNIVSVEVFGGGCRSPFVKDLIMQAVPDVSLSYSLDDTSAALGAALVGEDEAAVVVKALGTKRTELQIQLFEAEQNMSALDCDMQIRADAMNHMEAHVLEMRSARDGPQGKLLPDTLDSYLLEVEDWLFSEQADNANKDEMLAKWKDTQEKTSELAKEYLEVVAKEKAAKDAEMEAQAKQAQAEEAAAGGDDEDDHDNRRLPKKRRMEIVMKNKAEANELFADGNYKFAAARYTKALTHCAKFVDLSPDDLEEVNGVKLSLNLNLALAYLKLENPNQALRVCNEALSIDGENAKALYRRASAYYEKKQWDLANKDVKKAINVTPDDKALKKLQEKIDAQIKRQKLKEKKMAHKMFG